MVCNNIKQSEFRNYIPLTLSWPHSMHFECPASPRKKKHCNLNGDKTKSRWNLYKFDLFDCVTEKWNRSLNQPTYNLQLPFWFDDFTPLELQNVSIYFLDSEAKENILQIVIPMPKTTPVAQRPCPSRSGHWKAHIAQPLPWSWTAYGLFFFCDHTRGIRYTGIHNKFACPMSGAQPQVSIWQAALPMWVVEAPVQYARLFTLNAVGAFSEILATPLPWRPRPSLSWPTLSIQDKTNRSTNFSEPTIRIKIGFSQIFGDWTYDNICVRKLNIILIKYIIRTTSGYWRSSDISFWIFQLEIEIQDNIHQIYPLNGPYSSFTWVVWSKEGKVLISSISPTNINTGPRPWTQWNIFEAMSNKNQFSTCCWSTPLARFKPKTHMLFFFAKSVMSKSNSKSKVVLT